MLDKPSPQRRQHSKISRSAPIADTNGAVSAPWIVETLLARLERSGDITRQQRAAGESFAELFDRAHFATLKAVNLLREPHHTTPNTTADTTERARYLLAQAITALGGLQSPAGGAAWFILGEQLSIRDWATRQGWAGKPIRQEVAKGTLLAALGVLEHHFGVKK